MAMPPQPAAAGFVRQVQHALQHLYDPPVLGKSPLLRVLNIPSTDQVTALRRLLLDAIEALRPEASVPPQAKAWRLHQVVSERYAEQFTLREVASSLSLSVRQTARLEHEAVHLLAAHVWRQHAASGRAAATSATSGETLAANPTPSREQEILYLRDSSERETTSPAELVRAALDVITPLARRSSAEIVADLAADLPSLPLPVTATRQALLGVLTVALQHSQQGRLHVHAYRHADHITIDIMGRAASCAGVRPLSADDEHLAMARELLAMSGASLAWRKPEAGGGCQLRIALPLPVHRPVLVIDDNTDTLGLIERYLADSRYEFVGTSDPLQCLALAREVKPLAVVLDVMLPGMDGWDLLGRLRAHPDTREVPVIICTVLPQEELALALGAHALLRKPLTQPVLLAALDRLLAPEATGSG